LNISKQFCQHFLELLVPICYFRTKPVLGGCNKTMEGSMRFFVVSCVISLATLVFGSGVFALLYRKFKTIQHAPVQQTNLSRGHSPKQLEHSTETAVANIMLASTEPEIIVAREKGNDYLRAKKFREALKCFGEALELRPSATEFSNRALANYHLALFRECFSDAQSAIQLHPTYSIAHGLKIAALQKMVHLGESKLPCQEIITQACEDLMKITGCYRSVEDIMMIPEEELLNLLIPLEDPELNAPYDFGLLSEEKLVSIGNQVVRALNNYRILNAQGRRTVLYRAVQCCEGGFKMPEETTRQVIRALINTLDIIEEASTLLNILSTIFEFERIKVC
jgi:hypothetical protein